jgi:hypothetical protein
MIKVGDKVVPSNPDFWVGGNHICTFVKDLPPYVIAECSANGKQYQERVLPSEIKCTYQKGEQMAFSFIEN